MKRGLFLVLVLLATVACGRYYWTQPGRDISAFDDDSQACLTEVRAMKSPVEPTTLYRYCMMTRGWRRTQLAAPQPGAFRGPEREEEALGMRPVVQPVPDYDARREECRRRMRGLSLGPRYAYDGEFNRCMGY
jgi:hypothetical protein